MFDFCFDRMEFAAVGVHLYQFMLWCNKMVDRPLIRDKAIKRRPRGLSTPCIGLLIRLLMQRHVSAPTFKLFIFIDLLVNNNLIFISRGRCFEQY